MFLISGAKQVFIKLRQVFVETPILNHFDSECHIQIETDAFGHAIGRIFSQLISDDLSQWYLVACFSQKIFPTEI